MRKGMEYLLSKVQKPARYTGGEMGCVYKDARDLRVCFCFPDTYEIGMSHLGLQILYGIANGMEGVWCERAFAPWPDMEAELREHGVPLYALESGMPLSGHAVLAFTLQYELCYTNVLNMLDLGGVPVRSADRGGDMPIVMAGGPCAYNPEPMADFIDVFAVGEGEELFCEMLEAVRQGTAAHRSRAEILEALSRIDGVYVPSLYKPPGVITKRAVRDLDGTYYPEHPLVPNTEVVHDRVMLELFRGCIRGCRFCQAGFSSRPVRRRSPDVLVSQGVAALKYSGCGEIALTSLSSSDYPGLPEVSERLFEYCEPRRVNLSLPSLRADSITGDMLAQMRRVRRSGLTFAPEAGTQRLRDVINKNMTEDELLRACALAFENGWSGVKLYFMLGLPTETDGDVLAIAELASRVYSTWRERAPDRSRGVRVTVSASNFVPKPQTPFQWAAQNSADEFARKADMLKKALRRQLSFSWHDARASVLEGVLARGDRRLGAAIESAWRAGCRMDAWKEHFDYQLWTDAISAEGLSIGEYTRARETGEPLPWGHISAGVDAGFLRGEYARAMDGGTTPDCAAACPGCGACSAPRGEVRV